MSEPLHMIDLRLAMRGLTEIGKMHSLPLNRVDDNYLVHCALGKLFQDNAPKPYCIESKQGRYLRVLGYANVGADALQQTASAFAEPAVYDRACDWEKLASKPLPESLPEGMKLQFELRACPVVRKSSAGDNGKEGKQQRSWRAGQELDAFLAEAWKPENDGVDLEREAVYRDWLTRQFETRDSGGVPDVDSIKVTRFSIARMMRRHGADRKPTVLKRPDVTLSGRLQVTDGEAFMKLMSSGVGRHKSFGFGMLKIRPAQ
ncbi:MAG: type I-E CRISPR-associated protein Cas6/Cse3/CasE [Persicimonas sp.]